MVSSKDILPSLINRGKHIKDILNITRAKAVKWQGRTLQKLLYKARETEYGKKYDFDGILISDSPVKKFQSSLPITDYSKMHPYWQKEYSGESNITWPGRCRYFALSSGTSEGSSKFIPVTDDQIKTIMRASRRQLFSIVKTDVPKDFLAKDYLLVGGSTDLNFDGTSYSGDLSGITTLNVPLWFDRFSQPPLEVRKQRDWHVKMEAMVASAEDWDIVMIAGVPAWIKILFEKIIARYNLKTIHDIWPNFSVYLWGGVALSPYKKHLDEMLSYPIKYFETYLASEGFIAFQTKQDHEGMRLLFRNNMYYEFVPFDESNFDEQGCIRPEAEALNLSEVQEGKDYALLITTPSGAWRYLIGDTIKFSNLETCEIRITGRTRHFLSICGEHLSVDNMNQALYLTGQELGCEFTEFTVKGYREGDVLGHNWYVACDVPGLSSGLVKEALDKYLCQLNDDYSVERRHALKGMKLQLLPEERFIAWMEKHGKIGGQSKFPRVLADNLYEDWCSFVKSSQQAT